MNSKRRTSSTSLRQAPRLPEAAPGHRWEQHLVEMEPPAGHVCEDALVSTASHLQTPGQKLTKREISVTLLCLPNPPLLRPPAAASVLPSTGRPPLPTGSTGLAMAPVLPPDQTSRQAPGGRPGPCIGGRSFQAEGSLPATRPLLKSCVSGKLDSRPWPTPPPNLACVPSGPGGGDKPGEDAPGPHEAQAACSKLTQPFLSPLLLTHHPGEVTAPTWPISLELGPRGPGLGPSLGPSTPIVRRADGTSPVLRGRPGPAPHEEGTRGAAGTELPAGSSGRRKPWTSAFGSLPCPRCRVNLTETSP